MDIGVLIPVWLLCMTAGWMTVRLYTEGRDHLGWTLLGILLGSAVYTPAVYWLAGF